MQEQTITICCLYGPNRDDPNFFTELFSKIDQIGNDSVILGGDWNLVIDPQQDYFNYKQINNRRARMVLLEKNTGLWSS